MLAIIGDFLLCASLVTPRSTADVTPICGVDLDTLIARLPRVGCESHWDPKLEYRVAEPDVLQMQHCVAGGSLTDAQWVRAILSTGALRWRERWPSYEPYAVSMEWPEWLGPGRITLTPRVPGWREARVGETYYGTCGWSSDQRAQAALHQALGVFTRPTREVVFDVLIEQGRVWYETLTRDGSNGREDPIVCMPGGDLANPTILWRGVLRLPVRLVESLEEAVAPVSSPEIEAAVAGSVGATLFQPNGLPQSGPHTNLSLDPDLQRFPVLRDVGVSLEVTAERHGKAIEIAALSGSNIGPWRRINSVYDDCGCYCAFVSFERVAIDPADPDLANWSLRVRGTDAGVLAYWGKDSHWSGEIVISLATALEQENARARLR